jgi:hypothetical protein
MRGSGLLLVAGTIALGAGGCGHRGDASADSGAGDSAAVTDSTPGPGPAQQPAAAQPDTNAVSATGATSSRKPSRPATTSAKPNPPTTDTIKPSPAEEPGTAGTTIDLSKGRPALVVFRDSIGQADIAWLESEGLAIVAVNKPGHSASVRVPPNYSGNPRANPRITRFAIAMR